MPTWTDSSLSVEQAFHQVWKSTVPIQPSFYLPITTGLATPPPTASTAAFTSSVPTVEEDPELATAEILAGIKFGAGSSVCSSGSASASPPRTSTSGLRKRPLTAPSSEVGDEERPPIGKKRKPEDVTRDGPGSAERWPPRKEFVYLSCVVGIPPVGRQKLTLFGKPCGRNEIIAKVVTMATGEACSRKLISSHAQVLKGRKELSKQLRDLLTTEESKSNDDEAAPVVYTIGPEWRFPTTLNRLMGLPESLDLRTAASPELLCQFFSEPVKPTKSVTAAQPVKTERLSPAPATSPTIRTNCPASSGTHIHGRSHAQTVEPRLRHDDFRTSASPLGVEQLIVGSLSSSGVHLPTPQSNYSHSSAGYRTPPPGYDAVAPDRPSLPPPSELMSAGLGFDFGEFSFQSQPVPRRLAPVLPHTALPSQRLATTPGRSFNQLPPPFSPKPHRIAAIAFNSSPGASFPHLDGLSQFSLDHTHGRRGSEQHTTPAKTFNMFDDESMHSIVRSYEKVSVEMLKRQDDSQTF